MRKKGNWLSALKRVFTTTPKDKASALTVELDQRPVRESKKKWSIGKTKHEGDTSGRFFHLQRGPSSVEKILGDAERDIQRVNLPPPKHPHDAYQHHQHSRHHRHHHQQQQQPQQHQQPLHRDQPYQQKSYQQQPRRDDQLYQEKPQQQQPRRDDELYQHKPQQQQQLDQKPHHPRHENPTHQRKPAHNPQFLLPPPLPPPRASILASALPTRTPVWPFAQRRFNAAATRIQAAYRGHMARRGYRALRGLVRLQVVMRGPGVRRQTASALRSTQTLVRVQAQVRWMRLQMTENRNTALHHNRFQQQQQQLYLTAGPADDRDGAESILSKWSAAHQAVAERRLSGWDDSLLPREEIQARVQRKVEAIAKRERALAYHYNQQQFKASPTSAYSALAQVKHGGLPIWWSWVDKQKNHQQYPQDSPLNSATQTPVTASYYLRSFNPPETTRQKHQTPAPSRPTSRPATSMPRRSSLGQAIRDDESLTSCPPVPSYMAPTVSAKAKVRDAPSPLPAPAKRRFSFGLTSSLWGGGGGNGGASSLFSGKGKETPSVRPQSVAGKRHRHARSIGDMSIDSTVSLPVGVGRSAFKYLK